MRAPPIASSYEAIDDEPLACEDTPSQERYSGGRELGAIHTRYINT